MRRALWAQAAVPLTQRNKGGAIVNIDPVRSFVADGENVQCDTSKVAITGLTRARAAGHSAEGLA